MNARHILTALAAVSDEWTYRQLGITDREPETLCEVVRDACGGYRVAALLAACGLAAVGFGSLLVWLGKVAAERGWFG